MAITMDASLKVVSGPLSERTIPIARKLLIGRADDCNLRLTSDLVSGYHCVLLRDEFTLRVRDLASRNGTVVNGRRIGTSVVILLHDDTLSIGEFSFLISLTQAASLDHSQVGGASPGISPPALQGTVSFDGDTLRVQVPGAQSPPPTPLPVKTPLDPHAAPPSSG
jgi:pSer/pThr/pTyr-binding forkhead associated (FHA) protein